MSKIIVLFEVVPTKEGFDKYLELAAELKPMLSNVKGFINAERFQSLNVEGKILSMNVWESEEDIAQWRNNLAHRLSQKQGKEKLFESYKITVCQVVREYNEENRYYAPDDSNEYFYKNK